MERKIDSRLIDDIIKINEKIQHVEKSIQTNEKKISQINQSNSWKFTFIFRKTKQVFNRLFGRKMQKSFKLLEYENDQLRKELYELKNQLKQSQLTNPLFNNKEVREFIRQLKADGELYSRLQSFMKEYEQLRGNYITALTYSARIYMNDKDMMEEPLYEKMIASLPVDEIPEFMVRSGLTEEAPIELQVTSFRGSLTMRMRQKQLIGHLPEFALDDKRKAYEFVKELRLKIPNIDEKTYSLQQIPKKTGMVIKPLDGAGARGVYLIHDFDHIINVKSSRNVNDWNDMMQQMKDDLEAGIVEYDEWMLEEIIYENEQEGIFGRDFKFYCFYGKVGLILEIIRYPETRQCWWIPSLQRTTTGKYNDTLFYGNGVSKEELQMAEELSGKIPAPFVRIDFLRSSNGLIFGEFTPKPGNYDEFDKKTDLMLGNYFLEAEGRLVNDLMNGKQFTEFKHHFDI